MLTKKQIEEIRTFAEKAENPLFFYDDDPDGLCSFLLFMQKYQKGKGACVKSGTIDASLYLTKIEEHNPDAVFLFDKPVLPQELFDQIHVPAVWIDHHPLQHRKRVHYYNPLAQHATDNRPTTYWSYQVTGGKKWIALVGTAADYILPEPAFFTGFEYKELLPKKRTPDTMMFESPYGKLIRIFQFATKGKSADVRKVISSLVNIESPYEILDQTTPAGITVYEHYVKMNKEYESLLARALEYDAPGKIFIYTYGGEKTSLTSMLSNELTYRIRKPLIIIGRMRSGEYKLSLRSRTLNVAAMLKNALRGIEGTGGGHMRACGAVIKEHDFKRFIQQLEEQIHD